jgi:hypothetical protein
MAMVIFLKKRSNSKREKLKRMCNLTMLHPVFLYHSLYTVYFIRFWKLQLSTWLPPLGCSQHTTGWSIFLIYFFFFFFQIGYDLNMCLERNGRWLVTHSSQVFFFHFFFFQERKKRRRRRGGCVFCLLPLYTPHTDTLSNRAHYKTKDVLRMDNQKKEIFSSLFLFQIKSFTFSFLIFSPFQRVVSVFLFSLTR